MTPIQSNPSSNTTGIENSNLLIDQPNLNPIRDISSQIKNLSDKLEELDTYERKKFLIINGIFGVIAVGTIACFIAGLALMFSSSAAPILLSTVLISAVVTPISYYVSQAIFLNYINYQGYKNAINENPFQDFVLTKNVDISQDPFDFEIFKRIFTAYGNYSLAQQIKAESEKVATEAEAEALTDLKKAEEKVATIKQKILAKESKKAASHTSQCDLFLANNYEQARGNFMTNSDLQSRYNAWLEKTLNCKKRNN